VKNFILIICSPRHSEFCLQLCKSIENLESNLHLNYKFIFILNDSSSIEDFKKQSLETDGLINSTNQFIDLASKLGDIIPNKKYRYELGALKFFLEFSESNSVYEDCEQILLTQCSYEFLKAEAFSKIFSEAESNYILGMMQSFQNYFLKIPKKYLNHKSLPIVLDKREAIMNESVFIKNMLNENNFPAKGFFLGVPKKRKEFKLGRMNVVEETSYFKKWKGTWHSDQIPDAF